MSHVTGRSLGWWSLIPMRKLLVLGVAILFAGAFSPSPIQYLAVPTVIFSVHHGFAPLSVDVWVRVLPRDADLVCLGWGGAATQTQDHTGFLAAREPDGVDCRPPARLNIFNMRLTRGTYLVRAWTERAGQPLYRSPDYSVRVFAALDDPAPDELEAR